MLVRCIITGVRKILSYLQKNDEESSSTHQKQSRRDTMAKNREDDNAENKPDGGSDSSASCNGKDGAAKIVTASRQSEKKNQDRQITNFRFEEYRR